VPSPTAVPGSVAARDILVTGVVQGVGFRPFVYRLAATHALTGWVSNGDSGVNIHIEGDTLALDTFLHDLKQNRPPAAQIAAIQVFHTQPSSCRDFHIRHSASGQQATTRISPDLPVCPECLRELANPSDPRHGYAYINCTNCGPRYSIVLAVPYDRANTTMHEWPMDRFCEAQYHDPTNRRFHAQPVACPTCGPHYELRIDDVRTRGDACIPLAATLLRQGKILAIKGLGGYHLACDARNVTAVQSLRDRKFRKEKPFALMAKDTAVAHRLIHLTEAAETLLTSPARPIVLATAKLHMDLVAPDTRELGVMLPYTPLHHLLFQHNAPEVLVMTSANRSNEPISYEDDDALDKLHGLCDGFLIGERRIARRVDDSIARIGAFGPTILRRARGYAPGAVATLPVKHPILAIGADLKNSITLVVDGQCFVSQHIGDLDHYPALQAFRQTIDDLMAMYRLRWDDVTLVHDSHPQYLSTAHAFGVTPRARIAVQHHRAHIASVLAEHECWDTPAIGISFDGTGYGDDGSIWGGEIFTGTIPRGFERVAHLRTALLPGGDAAAREPVQAAAGFLSAIPDLPDLHFPDRYSMSRSMIHKRVRTFQTTSVGRLFDTAAAILGFTGAITFEGQAAMWLEQLAVQHPDPVEPLPFPFRHNQLDYAPLLHAMAIGHHHGVDIHSLARAFHLGIAQGVRDAVLQLSDTYGTRTIVFSGGVFQNELLLNDLKSLLSDFEILTNSAVPANDGGISLGQAALAAFPEAAHA